MRMKISDQLIRFQWVKNIIDKYQPNIRYEIGFTGYGPTELDHLPIKFKATLLDKCIRWIFDPTIKKYIQLEKEHRQNIWKSLTKDI